MDPRETTLKQIFVPDILSIILSLLGSKDLKNCRLVCKAWLPEINRLLFSTFICHTQATKVQDWLNAGLWHNVREIHSDWSPGGNNDLLEKLTLALSKTETIVIGCRNLRCRCCPPRISSGLWEYEKSLFWIVLTAVSAHPKIQLQKLILASNINDTTARNCLPEVQSCLSRKLELLRELVIPGLVEEELPNFLKCCVRVNKLCLVVDSFEGLDRIRMPKLQELRVRVLDFDHYFEEFLKLNSTLQCLVVSIIHWRARFESVAKNYGEKYKYCGFFNLRTNPWEHVIPY